MVSFRLLSETHKIIAVIQITHCITDNDHITYNHSSHCVSRFLQNITRLGDAEKIIFNFSNTDRNVRRLLASFLIKATEKRHKLYS